MDSAIPSPRYYLDTTSKNWPKAANLTPPPDINPVNGMTPKTPHQDDCEENSIGENSQNTSKAEELKKKKVE